MWEYRNGVYLLRASVNVNHILSYPKFAKWFTAATNLTASIPSTNSPYDPEQNILSLHGLVFSHLCNQSDHLITVDNEGVDNKNYEELCRIVLKFCGAKETDYMPVEQDDQE